MTRALVLLLLAATAARAGELRQTFVDPGHASNDFFGAAIATDGATVLAGARFADVPGAADAGAAYVFDTVGTLRTLVTATPAAGDQLGSAVAFLGAAVLVGAPHRDSGAPHAGAVFLFDGANVRTFTKPTPAFDDLFGAALAVVGTDVLVGAPSDSTAADGAGAAYLVDGRSGALLRVFQSPHPAPADLFGAAVAAAGGIVAVGAPFDDTAAPNAGAVYLFDAPSGTLLRTLTSPHAEAGDFFGAALAASGSRILVGAPTTSAAHVFDAASGTLLRSFSDPSSAPDDRFGAAVALAGDRVLVGAPFDDTDGHDTGIAYLFDATSGALLATYHDPTAAPGDQFGSAVAAAGDLVVVSAWLDDTAAPNAGAVYLFSEDALPPVSTTTSSSSTTTLFDGSLTTTTSTTTSTTAGTAPPAVTTTSTPSTTVPVAEIPTPTTTLVPAVACPECDDHDPCTTDGCAESSGCQHVALAGLDAAVCRLDALDAVLHEVPARALGGRRLAAVFQLRVATARRLVDRARTSSRRSMAGIRRARRLLARLQVRVRRGMWAGHVAQLVGANVLALAGDASGRLP